MINLQQVKKIYRLYESKSDRFYEIISLFNKRSLGKEIHALKDINLEINQGEILGIIGPNGAGKSTLIKVIAGIVTPNEGVVKVDGIVESIIELGAAFNVEQTGHENINFYLKIRNIPTDKRKEISKKIAEFSELKDFLHQPLRTYSSGMFARLAFATIVHLPFSVLIVDEALSVGDTRFQNKCIRKMEEIAKEGKTVIFVSHDMHAIKYFCKRIIRLDKGQIIDDTTDIVNAVERYEKNMSVTIEKSEIISNHKTEYVQIKSIEILNNKEQNTKLFKVGEDIKFSVSYEIFEYLPGMFFGLGIRNGEGVYINGLNTKLDHLEFPDKLGKGRIQLTYKSPKLYNDTFTLWGVFYNKSGTVVLADYIIRNAFEIKSSENKAEGVLFIEHDWKFYKHN